MLQLIVKKNLYFWLLVFLLLFTTFNIKNFNINFFFKIKKVELNTTKFLDESTKSKLIDFMLKKNLFLIDKYEIEKMLYKNNWVKKVDLKKKYPNTIIVNISEYFPIAYYENNKKFYIINSSFRSLINTNNIDTIGLIKLENIKNLKNFEELYKIIYSKFHFFSEIKKLTHVYGNRWDILLKNQTIIKLGNYNLEEQITNSNLFLSKKNIKTLDFRIQKRMVISYDK